MECHWAEDRAAESHELALYPQYIGKTSRSLSLLECLTDSNNFFLILVVFSQHICQTDREGRHRRTDGDTGQTKEGRGGQTER